MSTTTLGPGARLRAAREAAGLSQADLARQLGVTPAAITNLESDAKRITLDRIDEVCLAIGCDPHSIDHRLSPLRLRK